MDWRSRTLQPAPTCSGHFWRRYRRSRRERRKHKPPFLAAWGKNDPFFLPQGAEAFKRDIPGADVRFFDTGHFALETHCNEIAAAIRRPSRQRHCFSLPRPEALDEAAADAELSREG